MGGENIDKGNTAHNKVMGCFEINTRCLLFYMTLSIGCPNSKISELLGLDKMLDYVT